MRGRPEIIWLLGTVGRLTPAYAGKTVAGCRGKTICAAHPRVCGEDKTETGRRIWAQGSPPRMRGRPTPRAAVEPADGLTPAYAGKTSPARPMIVGTWAHPRVCGEDPRLVRTWRSSVGSPPRMRGRRPLGPNRRRLPGLTPAYAGKTEVLGFHVSVLSAHPRVCGED